MTEPKITIAEHAIAFLQGLMEHVSVRLDRRYERRKASAKRQEAEILRLRKHWFGP